MGNVVPTGRAGEEPSQLVTYIDDSRLVFQDELWNGKFLKSARCQSGGNSLVVKVYEKIPATDPKVLRQMKKELEDLRDLVQPSTHPNVLSYCRLGENSRVAYVMRQYTSSNLHDRQSTRPFLAPMEKRWIAYQMLKALSQCHQSGLVHGDIKAENFLVTSYTWVLLADFAPYKPTFLPLDDTAPYNYFFDSSNKRDCCCVAPERFRSPTSIIDISLLDSATPQCASVLSVMLDSNVSTVDAEFELAEASASLEAAEIATAQNVGAAASTDDGDASDQETGNQGNVRSKLSPANRAHGLVRRQRSYSFDTQSRSLRLRPSMDIFSLGCVIAELFMDGEACFNLAEVLRYANPEHGAEARAALLKSKLDKIKDPAVRPLVASMLSAEPSQRKSADLYLSEFTGLNKLFPQYFERCLHPFFQEFLQEEFSSPDERIWEVCRRYGALVESLCGLEDKRGATYFTTRCEEWIKRHVPLDINLRDSPMRTVRDGVDDTPSNIEEKVSPEDNHVSPNAQKKDEETVRDLLLRTQKIMNDLSALDVSPSMQATVSWAKENVKDQYESLFKEDIDKGYDRSHDLDDHFTTAVAGEDFFLVSGPGSFTRHISNENEPLAQSPASCNIEEDTNGVLIIVHMLATMMRFARYPSTKVVALCMILRLSRFSNDETRLQRVLPYVVVELNDGSSLVRCTALRVLTDLVRKVKKIPASDSRIFPEYLFPSLSRFKNDSSLNARLTLAECLPRLAEASAKFLELARLHHKEDDIRNDHLNNSGNSNVNNRAQGTESAGMQRPSSNKRSDLQGNKTASYDAQLTELHDIVQDFVSNMIEQPAVVRRTLLCDITRLCLFFGRERTSSHILPILITCLSERNDWRLRATFFEHIPGVSALVGPLALQQFLLPCIVQSLYEFEELVVERTLTCVYSLTELGLLGVTMMTELTAKILPLVYHPSMWIRNAVVRVLASLVSSKRMTMVEVQVTIVRLIDPFLKEPGMRSALLLGYSKDVQENEAILRELLVDQIPRDVYETAAAKYDAEASPSNSHAPVVASRPPEPPSTPQQQRMSPPSEPALLNAGSSSSSSSSSSAMPSAPNQGTTNNSEHTSSSSGTSWLKLSHKTPKKSESAKQSAVTAEANDLAASPHAHALQMLEPFFKASASLTRGKRAYNLKLELDLPADYAEALKGTDIAILVPEQSYVTLAIHSRYSEYLDQMASVLGPGVLMQHQQPDFKRIVNSFGIVARSRRHGPKGPDTAEALSGGVQRLTQRIRALEVPPLPPDMGTLRKLDGSHYVATVRRHSAQVGSMCDSAESSLTRDAAATPSDRPWRPRGVLAANLYGHDSAVNRVVTSQDNLFFATGSDDGTVRLWMTAGLEDGYGIRPKLTYASQGGCIADLAIIENTHSVAAASTSGSVHVFKVEHALDVTRAAIDPSDLFGPSSSVVISTGDGSIEDRLLDKSETRFAQARAAADGSLRDEREFRTGATVGGSVGVGASGSGAQAYAQSGTRSSNLGTPQQRSLGASTVLELNVAQDGPVRAVCHFTTMSESMLVFASESGAIHGWDLRARKRAWVLRVGPQAGVITSLAVPPEGDPIWLVAGTSRGVILLYDLRFSILLKAWRHPSHARIHRLHLSRATCSDPFLYVAAGVNTFSLYNIASGEMVHSYRTVSTKATERDATQVENLEEVDVRALAVQPAARDPIWSHLAMEELDASRSRMEPSVRAVVCPFDMSDVRTHMSHIPTTVLSAGTDRRIRYWHHDPSLCYSIFDQEFGNSVKQYWDSIGKVVVCREDIAGHKELRQQMHSQLLQQRQQQQLSGEGRGLPHPSTNHEDAILDLAFLNASVHLGGTSSHRSSSGFLLSASRDGIVKAWA